MLSVNLDFERVPFALEVRFTAPTPGITALYGPSGAGKTTLIEIIAGLLRPSRGQIELDGASLYDSTRGVDIGAERRRIGCVFQDLRLFPHLSVNGNLHYGLRRAGRDQIRITPQRVVDLLELGALLQRRTMQLSGGERQRVALGRALLAQPRLLLLDEPLAAVDAARRAEVLPYFERLRDELALPMVLVTHQFEDVVRLATHVVLLDAGRVLAQGDLPAVSLLPELATLLGSEGVGAVITGRVAAIDGDSGLATVAIGSGQLLVPGEALTPGQAINLQLLARDLILATTPPQGLSVRNQLCATVTALRNESRYNLLVSLDAGGVPLLARVTAAAARELQLHSGMTLWVLVKAVSLRGHAR